MANCACKLDEARMHIVDSCGMHHHWMRQQVEEAVAKATAREPEAVPMLLWCPECSERHIDMGEFATRLHHTHACQGCGHVWRPAIVPTVGVKFLPGFKDADHAG